MASKKSKTTGTVVVMLIVSIVGGALIGAYVMSTPDALHVPADLRRQDQVAAKTQDQHGKRFIPSADQHGQLKLDGRVVTIPKGEDPHVYLVNQYLDDLHAKGLGKKDARLLGVDVRGGTAYADFNQSFDETYGTSDEGNVLNGILTTFGQFPEIDRVQFEIDGKPMETTGNVDLSQPQDVIRNPNGTSTDLPAPLSGAA